MRWIVVLTCVLVATAATADQRLVVGESTQGVFYWHGHRIAPPYRIEVGFTSDPDTQWTATYINDLPLDRSVPAVPPPIDWVSPSLEPDQQALSLLGWREWGQDYARGLTLRQCLDRLAELLRSEPGLVDSVHAAPYASDILIWWHGWYATPESHAFVDPPLGPSMTRAEQWTRSASAARQWPIFLGTDAVVLWGGGGLSVYSRAGDLDAQIQRFQAGDTTIEFSRRLDMRSLADLRAPRPMNTLLGETGYSPPPPPIRAEPPPASDVRRVRLEQLGESDATVFIAGREAKGPFILEGEFVANPDTTWISLLLNGAVAWSRSDAYSASADAHGTEHWRPGVFRMMSFALRRGGLIFVEPGGARIAPRLRRPDYAAEVDSLRAAAKTPFSR